MIFSTFASSFSPFKKSNSFRLQSVGTTAFAGLLAFVGVSAVGAQSLPTSQALTNAAPNVSSNVSAGTMESDFNNVSASEIWSNFLFGSPNANDARRRTTPKFAFSSQNGANIFTPSQRQTSPNANGNLRGDALNAANFSNEITSSQRSNVDISAQNAPTQTSVAAARRQRLQELNTILAARRPDDFARRRSVSQPFNVATNANVPDALQNNSLQLVQNAPVSNETAERLAELRRAATQNGNDSNRAVVSIPFNAAQANRSKIRQASNLELASGGELDVDDFNNDALGFAYLPVRPNALQIAPRVFLSSEIVALPNSGPVVEPESNLSLNIPEPANVSTSTQYKETAPTTQRAPSLSTSAPSALGPTRSASVPLQNASNLSTRRPLFRPASAFVDPNTVPDR